MSLNSRESQGRVLTTLAAGLTLLIFGAPVFAAQEALSTTVNDAGKCQAYVAESNLIEELIAEGNAEETENILRAAGTTREKYFRQRRSGARYIRAEFDRYDAYRMAGIRDDEEVDLMRAEYRNELSLARDKEDGEEYRSLLEEFRESCLTFGIDTRLYDKDLVDILREGSKEEAWLVREMEEMAKSPLDSVQVEKGN